MQDVFVSGGAAFFGGIVATAVASRVKGLIYYPNHKKFFLFRNFKVFKKFVNGKYPNLTIEIKKEKDETEIIAIKRILKSLVKK